MSDTPNLNRRGFLAGAGAFAISAVLPQDAAAQQKTSAMKLIYRAVTEQSFNAVYKDSLSFDTIQNAGQLKEAIEQGWDRYVEALIVAADEWLAHPDNKADAPAVAKELKSRHISGFGFDIPLSNDARPYLFANNGTPDANTTNLLFARIQRMSDLGIVTPQEAYEQNLWVRNNSFSEAVYNGLRSAAIRWEEGMAPRKLSQPTPQP